MKKWIAGFFLCLLLVDLSNGGTLERVTRGTYEQGGWYADREWNVQVWGAYALTENSYHDDQYLAADHAWGGGLGVKYFLNRYLGMGLEGYGLSAKQSVPYIDVFVPLGTTHHTLRDERLIGAGMATITLRYPIGDSRFAPYFYGGGGAIAGGGQEARFTPVNPLGVPPGAPLARASFSDSETKAVGVFGAGLEIRLSRHLGILNDFSWNIIDGRDNDFGMARSGLNFAF